MKIYIAGPMSKNKDFNFPSFDVAKDFLKTNGHVVINPADMDRELGFEGIGLTGHENINDYLPGGLKDAIRRDISALLKCDAIFMLKDWEYSTGATTEFHIARWAGLKIFYQ